jgi:hypothetical protein
VWSCPGPKPGVQGGRDGKAWHQCGTSTTATCSLLLLLAEERVEGDHPRLSTKHAWAEVCMLVARLVRVRGTVGVRARVRLGVRVRVRLILRARVRARARGVLNPNQAQHRQAEAGVLVAHRAHEHVLERAGHQRGCLQLVAHAQRVGAHRAPAARPACQA